MIPSRLTLGTAQLGMRYGVANRVGILSQQEAFAVLDAAVENGVSSLDTAPAYGDAEERVGAWLKLRARDVVVTTKLSGLGDEVSAADLAGAVAQQVERSIARLGRIDHYLLHDTGDLRRHGERLVDVLARLQQRGLVGAVGASVYGSDDLRLVLEHLQLRSVQVPLNLLDHRLVNSGLLSCLRERGLTVFARSAYLQGLFSLDIDALPTRVACARPWLVTLREVLARFQVTPLDVALAYVAGLDGVTTVVVGAETPEQIRESAARMSSRLPDGLAKAVRDHFVDVEEQVIDPSSWPSSESLAGP